MTDFYVGQKVVCVNDSKNKRSFIKLGIRYPVRGEVYTIRHLDPPNEYGPLSFRLDEIVNDVFDFCDGRREPSFKYERFRPLVEKPDAIEWARQICRDVESRPTIDADAMRALAHLLSGTP